MVGGAGAEQLPSAYLAAQGPRQCGGHRRRGPQARISSQLLLLVTLVSSVDCVQSVMARAHPQGAVPPAVGCGSAGWGGGALGAGAVLRAAGLQAWGASINFVAQWCVGLPLSTMAWGPPAYPPGVQVWATFYHCVSRSLTISLLRLGWAQLWLGLLCAGVALEVGHSLAGSTPLPAVC